MVRSDHLPTLAQIGPLSRRGPRPVTATFLRRQGNDARHVEDAMKRIIWGTAITAAVITMAAWRGLSAEDPSADTAARVQRGQYLVTAIGCDDCHTPKKMGPRGPEPDLARMLSGHPQGTELPPPPAARGPWAATAPWDLTAWSGPWGVSYAMNLTPDQNTGIGIWTEDMFVSALRTGRHMGASRPILPPMPW